MKDIKCSDLVNCLKMSKLLKTIKLKVHLNMWMKVGWDFNLKKNVEVSFSDMPIFMWAFPNLCFSQTSM